MFQAGQTIRGLIVLLLSDEYRKYLLDHLPDYSAGDIDSALNRLCNVDGMKKLPELTAIYHQISNFHGNGILGSLFIESKFNELISLFLQCCLQDRQEQKDIPKHRLKEEDMRHIAIVKQFLTDHLEDPVNMAYLARLACMSQSKLKYCFRAAAGCSVTEWLQNYRMQIAGKLLLSTELSVREVALRVGYKKAGSFSAVFKRLKGLSPTEFRKKGKKVPGTFTKL